RHHSQDCSFAGGLQPCPPSRIEDRALLPDGCFSRNVCTVALALRGSRPFSPFRSCVLPAQRVPANFQYFSEHTDAIAQWVDARAFPMRPCHRDLRDSKTKLPRQEEQFGVESPALNLL